MEQRVLMAAFVVTSALDSGAGTLREAITLANATPGADTINFGIGSGPVAISPLNVLPKVLDPVTIDGASQPGFAGSPLVTLLGAGGLFNGLHVSAGGSTIRSLAITGFGLNGIELDLAGGNVVEGCVLNGNGDKGIDVNNSDNRIGGPTAAQRNIISGNGNIGIDLSNGGSGNTVIGNYIGTDASGSTAVPNAVYGLRIVDSTNNVIGGTLAGARNVISGNNSDGIRITGLSTGNVVQGNLIGTNAAGDAGLGNGDNGITIFSANNRIGGTDAGAGNVISGNRVDGMRISGATAGGNVVQGNRIGTDASGSAAIGNGQLGTAGTAGIRIIGASGTVIGGTTAGARNLVSGNFAEGIRIDGLGASGNNVLGNYIGTNASGTAAIGNDGDGIQVIVGGHAIGGTAAGAANLISGNLDDGIELQTTSATGSTIQGNLIGTDFTGLAAMPNRSDGIEVQGGTFNQIGGTVAAARNVLAGNMSDGIEVLTDLTGMAVGNVVQGNYVGLNAAGNPLGNTGHGLHLKCGGNAVYGGSEAGRNLIAYNGLDGIFLVTSSGNDMSHNSIHSNGGMGIDIGLDGVTPNDLLDADTGPNDLQNFPTILSAESGGGITTVHLTLDTAPLTTYRVDLYASLVPDLSGYGEGLSWSNRVEVTTDASGHADFFASIAAPAGLAISATAMDPANNTSEFSAAVLATVDVTAPNLVESAFVFDQPSAAPPHTVTFRFDDDVSQSLTAADFVLQNLTTGTTIPSGAISISFSSLTQTALLTFPGLPGGVLPDGSYRVTLVASSVQDNAGNTLNPAAPLDFFVLAGDANRDRAIGIGDFSILASRFNQPGTFSQGDFNYSGIVEIGDFSILAARFNQALPSPARAGLPLARAAVTRVSSLVVGDAPKSPAAGRFSATLLQDVVGD